ncbi:MAG: hypothetical protein K6A43_06080 [Treponema sp.]|nr:hypothetical protein [Treponema sp.]
MKLIKNEKSSNEQTFEQKWEYYVDAIADIFRLEESEIRNLRNSVTAKIIAAIPFAAECKDADRTAIAHLSLYMVEKKGFQEYCCHLPSDDEYLLKRLAFISTFEGGDEAVIEHGMYMLALIMVEGYKRSAHRDIKYGIYNPIANGKWNYAKTKKEILDILNKTPNKELDSIMSMEEENPFGW